VAKFVLSHPKDNIVVVVIIIIHFFTGEIKNEKVENEAILQAFNCPKVRKIKIKICQTSIVL
jgi:hypothetical protein